MDLIDSQSSRVLAKALDGVMTRHSAIISNIANAETPGFASLKVDFEDQLKQAIDAENAAKNGQKNFVPPGSLKVSSAKHFNPKHIASSIEDTSFQIERVRFENRVDRNGVDIEQQMADLAKNTQRYQALSRMAHGSYESMKSVIRGAGGA